MSSLPAPTIGTLLKRYRRAAGLTQEELAERALISADTISTLERGVNLSPRKETIELLADALFLAPAERARLHQVVRGQVMAPAAEPAPQPPLQHPPPRLPLPLNSFVGRQRELAEIQRLLDLLTTRLLTLTGAGGCGKTRLGLQVATALADRFVGGVFFVNLAPLTDPTLVVPTIAQTLDLREETGRPLFQRLVERLQQPVLLLLDNFEQVVSAAVQVADLLAVCPPLKVLVTSRTVLRVQAEVEFLVPPLALPPLTRPLEGEELAQYAAVALFLERVRAFKPDFKLTESNARPVAEICVRLDGLPLALELAAARVRLLPPQALLTRLAHGLAVLTGGARDVPLRQQTLRNTLMWSYDLLGADEQVLFRQLATFVGGCTLEAAETLAKTADNADLDVFNTLSALLENNLIQQSEQEGEEPRFLLLQTVREYGLELVAATGELEVNRAAHAHYYLALAEQAQPELHGPQQTTWLRRLEQEHDNLRAALEWALETVAGERAKERRKLALRFCAALWEFWRINGHYAEGRTFLERALALGEGEDVSLRAKALRAAANLALWQGDYARAETLAQQGLGLYQELGDAHGLINSLFLLGGIAWRRGKLAEALALYEERVRLMRHIGKPWEIGQALYYLADLTSMHGEYARGQALFEEALVLFQKADDELWVGATLVHSAWWLFYTLGDPGIMRQRLHEGEALITKVGNQHWIAECSSLKAGVALYEGELARAASLAKESLAIYREMGSAWFIAFTLPLVGKVETQRGELTEAHSAYQESLVLCQGQGEQFIVPFTLEGLAELVATQGELGWAANLWGVAEAFREAIASPLPPLFRAGYAQAVVNVRAQLGESAFAAAWQTGRTMTLEQVVATEGAAAKHTRHPM